ncbi:CdaR family protein [Defluviitalea phaphyphila]|uniref:CdaR family protein n=1 Tax=Defluviitalea phaphyphila TaxID=1473580 RepID=UPI00072FCC82|nr:CdaR family protein [Defluviitalea phaphyphila]
MNEFFGKNIQWKILSIILAISLWLVVINIENPEETMTFTIPVTLENIEEITSRYNLVISNMEEIENKTISVSIRGKRLTLEELKDNKRYLDVITATADLELFRYTSADQVNKIPIVVSFSDDYKGVIFEERNQIRYLDVVLEEIKTVSKPIQVDTIGAAKDGYVILESTVNPSEITITGAESLINSIDSVKVEVDVTNISTDKKEYNIEPKIYDSEGKEISNLEKNIEGVEVDISVGKKRIVSLQPKIEGSYAEGYVLTGIKIEPEEITVVGSEEVVDDLNQVELSTIIFEDLDTTTTFKPDIILPSGVIRWDDTSTKVSVTIEVKKEIVKEFKIPTSRLTISTKMQFRYITDEVTLYIQGIEDEVNKITENMIVGSIDVLDYDEGKYTVPVEFSIPKGFKQVGETPMVEIELINSEDQKEDEEVLSEYEENNNENSEENKEEEIIDNKEEE